MKRIIYKAVLALFVCFSVTSNTYGQYLIEQSKIYSGDVNPETSTDKVKVTYNYDNESINKYYPKGYELSLKDMPVISTSNSYYTWSTGSIADIAKYDGNDLILSTDLVVTGNSNQIGSNVGNDVESDYRESIFPDGIRKDSSADKSVIYDNLNIQINDTIISKNIDAYVSLADSRNYSDGFSLHAKVDAGNAAVNIKFIDGSARKLGDDSIGLETTDEDVSDYKPRKGNTTLSTKTDGSVNPVSTNYCVRRFVLNNDVIYKGTFNLGAQNGFYSEVKNTATNKDSQAAHLRAREYTGFICGQYYEIDLNGHDLILAEGATINAYGSITDSSEDRSGNIVLESGSTLLTSFVTEGQYHETDIVSAYKYSQDPFRMFRCPYLDCTTIIKTGSKLQGRIIKADGGNSSTVGFASTTTLIGPSDSNPFIQLNSGIIKREVSYN